MGPISLIRILREQPPMLAVHPHPPHRFSLPTYAWLPVVGIVIGGADLAFAAAYWAPHGVAPIRIPQSIAAWILGSHTARAGGWSTALFGMALYFTLTSLMVEFYHRLGTRHDVLLRRPYLCGALYGIAMYCLLFKLAVPLWTGSPAAPEPVAWTVSCTLAYMLLIGIPCALFARIRQGLSVD